MAAARPSCCSGVSLSSMSLALLLPLALLLSLVLCPAAEGAKYDFYVKRFMGSVDAICVTTDSAELATLENADELIIGSSSLARATNHLCASIVWVQVSSLNTIFQLTDTVPSVLSTASFNTSIWTAKPSDSVSLTVENALPNRQLSVEGSPVPVQLAAPGATGSDPPSATLGARPARQFNASYATEADTLGSFLDWFLDIYVSPLGAQGAILYYLDNNDPEGNFLKAIYTIFKPTSDGGLTAHLFKASFAEDAATQATVGHKRRLLQVKPRDKATAKTVTCKKVWTGKVWVNRCI